MLKLLLCVYVAWSSSNSVSGSALPDATMYQKMARPRYPWNQFSDTYGYVDRYPALPAERDTGDLVFGVAHRYLGDSGVVKTPLMYPADEDYYVGDNDWSDAEMQRLWMVPKRSGDAYDWSEEKETDAEPSAQDVINFENYIQRYVLPQLSSDDQVYDAEEPIDDVYRNDDEADKQLHSLLPQRYVKAQYHKKTMPATSTTTTTSTTPMTPTSTTVNDVLPAQLHRQVGQKEEALLRPPAIVYQPTLPAPQAQPSIYESIKRIINIKHQIKDVDTDSGRSKRFIAPEDSLMKQLHDLNKSKF